MQIILQHSIGMTKSDTVYNTCIRYTHVNLWSIMTYRYILVWYDLRLWGRGPLYSWSHSVGPGPPHSPTLGPLHSPSLPSDAWLSSSTRSQKIAALLLY